MNELVEVSSFPTDKEFQATEAKLAAMVREGKLKAHGLDPAKSPWFVEVYEDLQGAIWKLAMPDQAFRGYLKRS